MVFLGIDRASAIDKMSLGLQQGDERLEQQRLEVGEVQRTIGTPDFEMFFGVEDMFFAATRGIKQNFIETSWLKLVLQGLNGMAKSRNIRVAIKLEDGF